MKAGESSLSALLDCVALAMDDGRTSAALRFAESARRFAPEDPAANLIYSTLLLEIGAAREALEGLRDRVDEESLLLRTRAGCAAGLPQEAARSCQMLLERFAVDSVPDLRETAARLCRDYPETFPGWFGVNSALQLVGDARAECIITLSPEASSPRALNGTWTAATFAPPVALPKGLSGHLFARAGPQALLGSGMRWPPDFGATGWVVLEDESLIGEAYLRWAPRVPVALVITHDTGQIRVTVEPVRRGSVGWTFSVPLGEIARRQTALHVGMELPDGAHATLTGSPLMLQTPRRRPLEVLPVRASVQPAGVNVVIPVHSGREETLACLRSVLATTAGDLAVVTVVDDASPDADLSKALDELARGGRISLLRNAINTGFPEAANRGMRAHPDRDVVLLNADAEVFDGWLERLRAAAYATDDIGTVTPLGEAASIASYPRSSRRGYSPTEAREIDAIARVVNEGQLTDIPVGVGFCLYIRRRCLDEVGEFDAQGFGAGYGEENDFCLRAREKGWRHVAATSVFVRHAGARSFGSRKALLTARNARVIDHRYPGYTALIETFNAADPLRRGRRAIDRQRLLRNVRDAVLLITLDARGGVERYVELRRAQHAAEGHTVVVLRAAEQGGTKRGATLSVPDMDLDDLHYELPDEIADLQSLLAELRLVRVELHHFLGLPGQVLELLPGLGAPYDVYVHDYAWICPRVTLLGGSGQYCGEPTVERCEECVRQHGSELEEALTVAQLRSRSARVFEGAGRVFAPSEDARRRLARYFPGVHVEVTPWQAPVAPHRVRGRRRDGRIRVALIGAIGISKGYAMLLDCARDAVDRKLLLDFVIVGYSCDDPRLLQTGRVFITGPYREEEALTLLDRECCDVILFLSPGPETWSYTLTYALMRDFPIVAFDIGAVGERLRAAGRGVLLPLDTPARLLNDELIALGSKSETLGVESRGANAAPAASPDHPFHKNEERAVDSTSAADAGSADISATVQLLTLPVGVYAFTVTSGAAPFTKGIALPALQVAPAPASSQGIIEFLSGPATTDRWLTRNGDVVLAKISGGSAVVLLTSLRSPQSAVLAIDVRRIDGERAVEAKPPTVNHPPPPALSRGLRPRVALHVQNVGDREYTEGWAGCIAENYWIEGFALRLSEPLLENLLEYKAVNDREYESPWLGGGALCGTRGESRPLLAFGVRASPTAAAAYRCAYYGRFSSGCVVGPVSDGALCRSEKPDDPLVAIDVRVEPCARADAAPG